MARLVPSTPRSDLPPNFFQALVTLENGLDDPHLIFQGWQGGFLILREGATPCHVALNPLNEGEKAEEVTGISIQPRRVPLSVTPNGEPLLQAVRDAMAPGAGGSGMASGEIAKILDQVVQGEHPYDGGISPAQAAWRANQKLMARTPAPPDLEPLVGLIRSSAEGILGERSAYLQDAEISAADIASPDGLLPAFLVAAALRWSGVVQAKGGVGGFRTYLQRRSSAPCGYVVTRIESSATLLLILPLMDALRSTLSDDTFVLNKICEDFLRWMDTHGHPVEEEEFAF